VAEEILYLQSRRAARKRRVQTVQHVFAATILFMGGIDHLHHTPALAIAEMVAAALLIGSVIRERVKRGHHQGGVAWVELAGAAMMFVEAVEKTRVRHHWFFYPLLFVQPMVLLAFALFDAQISARRYIKADEDGLELRTRLFFRKRISWTELASGVRPNLRDVLNRQEAESWIAEKMSARELPAH
jgi:hypothetical protein